MNRLYRMQQEAMADKGEFENMTVGQGGSVHIGHRSVSSDGEISYFTACGADHATNRGMRSFHLTEKQVSCKRCLKKSDKGNRSYLSKIHTPTEDKKPEVSLEDIAVRFSQALKYGEEMKSSRDLALDDVIELLTNFRKGS